MRRRSLPHGLLALALGLALAQGVIVASADNSPTTFLVVDSPTDGSISGSQVILGGWALSTESQSGTGIDRVQVYIDGPAETGVPLGQATYGLLRQDVAVVAACRPGPGRPQALHLRAPS
jgi:hypothetical protein